MSTGDSNDLSSIRELLRASTRELLACEAALLRDLDAGRPAEVDTAESTSRPLLAIYRARSQIELMRESKQRPRMWHGQDLTLAALAELQDEPIRILGIKVDDRQYTVFQDAARTRIVGVLCTRPAAEKP
jgi:hypothetical protein